METQRLIYEYYMCDDSDLANEVSFMVKEGIISEDQAVYLFKS